MTNREEDNDRGCNTDPWIPCADRHGSERGAAQAKRRRPVDGVVLTSCRENDGRRRRHECAHVKGGGQTEAIAHEALSPSVRREERHDRENQ